MPASRITLAKEMRTGPLFHDFDHRRRLQVADGM